MRRWDWSAVPLAASTWRTALVLAGLLACAILMAPTSSRAQTLQGTVLVEDVTFHGLRAVSAEQVRSYLKTLPGREYSAAILQEDVTKLTSANLFRNVRVHDQITGDGRMVVHFYFEEFPNVIREVIYKNAHHVSTDELNSITGLRKGSPVHPALNRKACFDIQDHYKKQGRYLASVTLEEGANAGDTRVVFNITEGPIVTVRSIRFSGNDTLASTARLKTQIDSKTSLIGMTWLTKRGLFVPALVDHDAGKLEDYYKSNGHLDVKVTREIIFNEGHRSVDVVFHIHEGQRYRIQDVSLEGTKAFQRDDVKKIVRVKQGEFYNEQAVTADLRNITDFYGYRGYGVAADRKLYYPDKDSGLVRVQYEVMERPPARVGEITIIGNTYTKDRVIRRALQIYPNQILSLPHVRQGERDLAKLGIFETNPETGERPTITVLESDTNSPYRDILVKVKETHTGSLNIGAGITSDAGLVGSIVLNERNFDIFNPPVSLDDVLSGRAFRGGGQEFRLEASPGTQVQRYSVSLREPFLFDRPISLTLSAFYFDRIYNEYTERRVGTRVSLGKQLNRFWSLTGGFRLEQVDVSDVPFFAPPDLLEARGSHFLIAPRVGLIRDSRDSYIRPTEGSLVEGSYEHVFGDFTFPVFSVEAAKYFSLFPRKDGSGKHVVALRSQAAWAGSDVPVFERFYAGGYRSLRGFEFRGVGPITNGFNVGGDFMFLNSLEYQIPITANDAFNFVAFLDSGTVEPNFDIKDYRVSAGVGLLMQIQQMGNIPISLNFGFPIVRAQNDREQLFSFYIGLWR
jgi:outer membrane protein insertion porin family